MKIKRSILWIAGSAVAALLALWGLRVMDPIDGGPNQSGFLFSILLCIILWLSMDTLLVSFLCCLARTIFRRR
jgi:hypothetical protein